MLIHDIYICTGSDGSYIYIHGMYNFCRGVIYIRVVYQGCLSELFIRVVYQGGKYALKHPLSNFKQYILVNQTSCRYC